MRPWIPIFLSIKLCALVLMRNHWPITGLVVLFAPDPWFLAQFLFASQQAFGPAITAFETTGKEVWLTIDDGPHPESTPQVLQLLKRHKAHATFFLIGDQVARYPMLARQIVSEGHTVGNHTHTHSMIDFWCASSARTASEIDRCVAALLLADVRFEHYFRPPVGIRNPLLEPQLADRGMQLVLWNARGFDGGKRSPESALARIAPQIRPGGILLSHEAGPRPHARLRFVALLLEHLDNEGYACVIPARQALRTNG